MSNTQHSIDISFDGNDERPTIHFRCDAPTDSLCHAYYDCECESWGQEGVIHGKPWHLSLDDENHFGAWKDECRLDDWFYNTDESLAGSVNIPVRPEYVDQYYLFHVGEAS